MKKRDSEIDILGYNVFKGKLDSESFFEGNVKIVVNTINAYSYVMAKSDSSFRYALTNSDILLPDGFPIQLASHFLRGTRIEKIAGEDIFKHLMFNANIEKQKVFFLGASESTLTKIINRAQEEYSDVCIEAYSPPFKRTFTEEDNRIMIEKVNSFYPDILFVGMTAPKQEKWVESNKSQINASIICSIGAVFDFYAGTVQRPSQFWIRLRLEWFIRLLKEPRRLWKRYLVYSPKFFIDVFKAKFKGT
ncbi:WecB/TagA/CpsF family glycosyltransferase [Carboxylicivirga sediminis]|uniref:WecB/TagA/CpsF family glycosyltransferase n=1 Tax=Carboxylicivirga sediminis TaxID=2006564 RepID=A0A941F6M9_9BACT|nr:WecB/TagA/CpsF family glycosyltransferase [Carboxylicivirga sediminis]MBR8537377.1 WecB/TagA/CpsF family glycosyltransferase [Carboxylicivirga sediminis]